MPTLSNKYCSRLMKEYFDKRDQQDRDTKMRKLLIPKQRVQFKRGFPKDGTKVTIKRYGSFQTLSP